MRWITGSCVSVAVLLLGGCQTPERDKTEPLALATLAVEKLFQAPECQADPCSQVRVSALDFPRAPALTDQVKQQLLALAAQEGQSASSWEQYAEQFFAAAREDEHVAVEGMTSEALLEAQVYAQYNDLLVLELNSYVYHAGQAHGMPLTQFMVIDERTDEVVAGEDMIAAGQEAAFRRALENAHRRWLLSIDQDEQFAINWPLSESRNIAPLEDGWEVKYDVYEIAPYAVGQPRLTLTNEELQGIAKPRYLGR